MQNTGIVKTSHCVLHKERYTESYAQRNPLITLQVKASVLRIQIHNIRSPKITWIMKTDFIVKTSQCVLHKESEARLCNLSPYLCSDRVFGVV